MKELKCDLHIVGGGLTGLLSAYCMSVLGYKIIISEKKNFLDDKNTPKDTRTTAIAEGSKVFLDTQGLWEKIKKFAQPIKDIKVIDNTTSAKIFFKNPRPNSSLGYIVKNSLLINLLIKELRKKQNVNFVYGSYLSSIAYKNSNIITFSSTTKIVSKMIIAADGKNSTVREILGTNILKKNYNEKALVVNFFHERPHQSIAYEFFLKTGPLAILPMQKEKNKNQSALIWSNKAEIVDTVAYSNLKKEFLKEIINEKIYKQLGSITNINSIQAFPLSAHINEKFYETNAVYIGDAAHSFHPIAGQGWNLGVRDVRSLTNLLSETKNKGNKIGTKNFCKTYNDLCYYDALRLFQVTDRLDWIFKKDQSYFKFTKKFGFSLINKYKPLKDNIVEFAMGI